MIYGMRVEVVAISGIIVEHTLEIKQRTMSKTNVNIVVFDQQSLISEHSRVQNSTSRRPPQEPYSSSTPQSVLSSELTHLNDKINALQEKAQKISELIRNSTCQGLGPGQRPSSMSEIINASGNVGQNGAQGHAQVQELLRVLEVKIGVVVQETKKIVDKMSGEFQKKLAKSASQKNHQTSSIAKIQAHCRETITKIQQSYQDELNAMRNEQASLERKLIQRVEQIQNDYRRKLKDFQNKEQQYIATIEHLENKLRVADKSKSKKLEVTMERPTSSVRTQPAVQNMSQMSSQQIGSSNALPPNDTSKRRTRIFDSKGSNRSISPNNQVLSPLKAQNNIKMETQSVVNKPANPDASKGQRMASTNGPQLNNFISQQKQPYPHIKATVITQDQPPNLPSPIPKLQKQPQKSTKRSTDQQNLREKTQKQFYKDVPKPQWERFQDFNDHQSSGSEQDVFFYPEHGKQQPKSVFDHSNNNSMHSPFDLN